MTFCWPSREKTVGTTARPIATKLHWMIIRIRMITAATTTLEMINATFSAQGSALKVLKAKKKKMAEFIPEDCTTMQPTGGPGFRMQVSGSGDADGCPVQQYQIASAQSPQFCVDGSKKRFTLKKCGATATDSNLFSVQKHGDGGSTVLLKNQGRCLLPTSVVKGPCKGGVTLVKTGAFHMIDTGEGECWTTVSRRVLTLATCDPKNRKQRFRLVPISS